MSEKEVLMRDFKHAYAAIPDASPNEDGNGCKANAHAGRDLESLAGQPSERKSDSNRWRLFAACTALSCLALLVFLSAGEQRVDPAGSLEMGATPSPKTPSPYPNIVHPDPPTSLWGNVQRPYPTGAWWTNLVVGEGKDLIGVYPYALKTQESGVQVSYGASRRVVSKKSIVDPFVADLQLGTKEAYLSRAVEAHDALSVTMGYRTVGGKYKTHVVKSSPFVTVVYDNATPEITAELMQINSVEAREVKDSPGVKYIVTLGNWQKWLVYCSQPVALQWSGNKISSSGPIQGYVRVAILPVASYEKAFDELMQYVQRYPTCGSVEVVPALTTETESWLGGSTGAEATLVFKYSTVGAGELLMLALPHQQDGMLQPSLDSAVNIKALAYAPVWCIKGKMRAVVGDSWRLRVPLVSAGWNYEVSDKLSTARLDEIAQDLLQEMGARPIGAPDPYGFGKELGRMASLALIADDLGIATARQTAVEMLEAALGPWLLGDNSNSLNYDTTYGGLLTTNGLADKQGDYGQGWYNDHHFHFGYFMHGAAVIAKLDPTWFEVADRRQAIDAIAKDICNADPADPNYPFARHKDFFDGHSWASGLFTQGNGKGQESSSEAANAYYAVMLFASATQNEPLREFAHVLLSME
ncbi:endo-1,3(4)-beta-glucanase, partial [Ochromonadaceae sp. CCMP2298]